LAPITVFDFDPHHLPDEILKALGLVAACSAQTEDVVQMGIASVLGVDIEKGTAITAHLNAQLRDNLFRSAAEIAIDNLDHLDELDKLLDEVADASKRRNEYLHYSIYHVPKTGRCFLTKKSARGSVQVTIREITAEEIVRDAERIYIAGLNLMAFYGKAGLDDIDIPECRLDRSHKTRAARKARRKTSTPG